MDPLQWMGAVRMRVQTADENITIITSNPHNSSLSFSVLWSNKLHVFKNIIKTFLTLLLLAKIRDFHNIAPEKKSSHLNLERNMHIPRAIYKWKQSKTVLNKHVGWFWGQQGMDFFTGGSIIMDYGHIFWPWSDSLKLKCLNNRFVS